MAKIKLKLPEAKQFRGWYFVIIAGIVLAVIALIDQGDLGTFGTTASDADGSTGCIVVVQVAEQALNLREGPSTGSAIVGQLDNASRVDATTTVTATPEGDFRQLEDGRWAAAQYLVPEPGSTC